MRRICRAAGVPFDIGTEDLAFYQQLEVPPPTLCPAERQRRRLAWRNERSLYRRTCSGSGRGIVATYPSDAPFPVFDHPFFFSDNWNPLAFGVEFDFNRPFFEQYGDLRQHVPRLLNYSLANENAEYGNLSSWNKDCYMCFEADNNRDCYYIEYSFRCRDVVDCSFATECELCYECVDIRNCYHLRHSLNCDNCSESCFLKNCIGCKNCFGCVNLRNCEYCFFNEKLSPGEYQSAVGELLLTSRSAIASVQARFKSFAQTFPHKYMHGRQNEQVVGDYLNNCKNARFCFDSSDLRDCRYVCNSERIKDGYDIDSYGGLEGAELVYECHSVGRGAFRVAFGNNVYQDLTNVWYSDGCAHGQNLFGCISLHHAQNCILNKQYQPEEYKLLLRRIVEHMTNTGEWGEFFPMHLSPFAYNESMAQFYYPLTKEEVLNKGLRWREKDARDFREATALPADSIVQVPDSICSEVLSCSATGRNFQIQKPELSFYRRLALPVPAMCPEQRYSLRMNKGNPRKLYWRRCAASGREFWTTFAPERPELVLSEEEYLRRIM